MHKVESGGLVLRVRGADLCELLTRRDLLTIARRSGAQLSRTEARALLATMRGASKASK